jgi:hypothetical protein
MRPPEPPDASGDEFEPEQAGLPVEPDPALDSAPSDPAHGAEAVFEPPWEPSSDPASDLPDLLAAPIPSGPGAVPPIPPRPIANTAPEDPGPVPPTSVPTPGPQPNRERPFAPVIFDDDGRGATPPPPFGEYDDSGVLRVLGVIVLLAIVIAVLVLPPVSIFDGGSEGDSGLSVDARDELPALPGGLSAVSQLYDLEPSDELTSDSLWTLTIKLSEATEAERNLAFYTHSNGEWLRLTSATLISGGTEAEAEVSGIPGNVAVLRRTAFERTLGLIVDAGEVPDPAGLESNPVVAVNAGRLEIGDDGTAAVSVLPDAIDAAAVSGGTVYLAVAVDPAAQAALDQLLATEAGTVAHVGELAAAVRSVNADGLYLGYLDVEPTRRASFTRLTTSSSRSCSTRSRPPGPNSTLSRW